MRIDPQFSVYETFKPLNIHFRLENLLNFETKVGRLHSKLKAFTGVATNRLAWLMLANSS